MFKKVLSFVVFMLVAVFCLTACGEEKEAGDEYLVIGGMGPLTGPASVYGQAVYNSAKMAVEEINEAGGLKNGLKLKLEFLDDAHDATKVKNNYYSLLEDKGMQVSIGCVTTGPCQEFKKYAKDDNVFFITPSASNDTVPEYANGYQMCFADGNQGTYAAQYVNANYAGQTVGAFYLADDDYSRGIYEKFVAALDGVTCVPTSFTSATATSFATQIQTLSDAGVEFVFMPIYYTPASLFMKQAKDVSAFSKNTVFYGCDGFDGIESMTGFNLSDIPQEISMLSHFDSTATTGKAGDFIKKYTETFGKETLNQFGASAYDCVYALVQALNEIEASNPGSVTAESTPSELCELLKAKFNNGFEFKGAVTGGEGKSVDGSTIKWSSNGYVQKDAVKYTLKEADK